MSWLESHQELRDHPKTARLRRRLGVSLPQAIGHLHLLWWWALDYAPTGHLAPFDADVLADASCWEDDPGVFVRALIGAGFLNDDMTIHDWEDYAGRLIDRREANAKRMRAARKARRDELLADAVSGARPVDGTAHTTGTSAGRERLPDLTGPNLNRTGPDRSLHPNPPPIAGEGTTGTPTIPEDVVVALTELPSGLDAAAFHDAAESALAGLGFRTEREVRVDDRGDGHAGRVDLVAIRGPERIAFELDDRTPREKSVAKLAGVPAAQRVIVLRRPLGAPGDTVPPPGIDLVVGAGRPRAPTLLPLDAETVALWRTALHAIRDGGRLSAGNLEQLRLLEPLGRDDAGALHLRAPPGLGLGRFKASIALALADAADERGADVVIREG